MSKRSYNRLAALLVLGILGLTATSSAQSFPSVLTGKDLTKVVPTSFYFQGESGPTQMRNAAAAKMSATNYVIAALVDTPPAGSARVDAFFTAGNDAVYAILPRRPIGEVVLRGIDAPAGVRATLLETGHPLDSRMDSGNLHVTIPASLSASLPARQAWVLKLAGAI